MDAYVHCAALPLTTRPCSYFSRYTQVSGIIFGQLVIGFFADRIGRKLGSILTASIMVCEG